MMVKRFLSYTASNGLASLFSFLAIPYLSRVLAPEEYGYIGLIQGAMVILVPLLTFSSEELTAIHRIDLSKSRYQWFISQYFSLATSVAAVYAVLFCLAFFIGPIDLEVYLLCIPLLCLFQSVSRVHTAELVQDVRPVPYGAYRIATSASLLLLTIVFISVVDMSWEGRLFAMLLAEGGILYIKYAKTFHSLRAANFFISKDFLKEIFRYGWPLVILLAATWAINEADRFIVLGMLSLADVGIYTVAYGLGSALNVINTSMTNAIAPNIYTIMKEKSGKASLKKFNLYGGAGVLCISLLAAVFIYYLGHFIVGEQYREGMVVSSVVLVAFGVNGMYRTVALPLEYLKLNKLKAQNIYIAAFINLSTSIYLTTQIGLLGPAYGTLMSFIVLYLLTLRYNLIHTREIA